VGPVVTIVDKLNKLIKILFPLVVAAFLANIWLFIYASINDWFDLEILSLCNMLLLSFALLRREDE